MFKETPNQFLMETLKQIGVKITNTKGSTDKPTKTDDHEEKLYVVYANINS